MLTTGVSRIYYSRFYAFRSYIVSRLRTIITLVCLQACVDINIIKICVRLHTLWALEREYMVQLDIHGIEKFLI